MHNQKKTTNKIIYVAILTILSIILTIPSMERIKNVSGVSFETEIDFVATAFLVCIGWFLLIAFCIWFTRFLINAWKLKRNPSSLDAPIMVERKKEDLKTASTLRKVIIGIMNVACIYLMIIFSISAMIAFGFTKSIGALMAFALGHILVILSLFACAVSDFIMMIKLRRNPYNKKALETREKGKKFFKTLIIIYICLYALMFVYILLFGRSS